MGITGIAGGITTALAQLSFPPAVFAQAMILLGSASVIGGGIGKSVPITELP